MDVLDELRYEAKSSYDWLEAIVSDVSDEQANWRPPGRANTIALTYFHIVGNADEDLNEHLFQRPQLSDGAWRGRTGVGTGPSAWAAGERVDWTALREYGRAMHAFVLETLDSLTEADLQRRVSMGSEVLGIWEGIEVIRLTVGRHIWMHGGEIACLKGLQGAKGYLSGKDAQKP